MAWVEALGGLGLFLLGMAFLTDSLEAALGSRVKAIMRRLTKNRLAAFGTGAGVTALIQSSSATSLITIGLVGAGLITLAQAIGVLIGANVGTTATGYLVALVGLKFSVSTVALPFVGVGGLSRVFTRGRNRIIGDLLLGFGLLFVGIDFMQRGMADVAAAIDLSRFARPGILAGLVLMVLGIALTVMMQSSSAAMAATLAALAGGAIDLRMGAYLVVGQNIGTTVTALIGAVGASINARRTAGAHLTFNLGTGLVALATLPWLLAAAQRMVGGGAVALAVFHTLFNLLGAAIFLPLAPALARGLERIVPAKHDDLTSKLDPSSLRVAAASSEAARQTVALLIVEEMRLIDERLGVKVPPRDHEGRMAALRDALPATRDFVQDARAGGWHGDTVVAAIHALDHLQNIAADLREHAPLDRYGRTPQLQAFRRAYHDAVAPIPSLLDADGHAEDAVAALGGLTALRKHARKALIKGPVVDAIDVAHVHADLEALHWLDRIAWHLRRALRGWARMGDPPEAPAADAAPDEAS